MQHNTFREMFIHRWKSITPRLAADAWTKVEITSRNWTSYPDYSQKKARFDVTRQTSSPRTKLLPARAETKQEPNLKPESELKSPPNPERTRSWNQKTRSLNLNRTPELPNPGNSEHET
jgi:hypothetical protein